MEGTRLKKFVYENVLALAQRTADASSGVFDGEPYDHALIYVNCTVATSGSMIVYLESSPDDGTTWYRGVGKTSTVNAAGQTVKAVTAPIPRCLRLTADLAGSTDLTFSVSLELVKE